VSAAQSLVPDTKPIKEKTSGVPWAWRECQQVGLLFPRASELTQARRLHHGPQWPTEEPSRGAVVLCGPTASASPAPRLGVSRRGERADTSCDRPVELGPSRAVAGRNGKGLAIASASLGPAKPCHNRGRGIGDLTDDVGGVSTNRSGWSFQPLERPAPSGHKRRRAAESRC